MKIVETLYDVIIVGSGGAGLKAALSAIDKGAKTLLITKGEPQRSGGTLSAHYSFCAVPPVSEVGDSAQQFADDIIRSSEGISDPSLVRVLSEQAMDAIAYAEQLGVKFDRTADGNNYQLGWLAGHTHARAFHVGNVVGRDLTRVLLRRLNKTNAEIHPFTQVLQLHVEDGQYKGLYAYHYATDELLYYRSKSVVIATGGGSQLYELNTNPVEATGDGYSLALQAGIEVLDMEFVQFYPTVLVSPQGTRGLMFNSGIVIPKGARIKNKHGVDFWDQYQVGELKQATRDLMSKIMAAEINAGNGTDEGGLIVDASMVDAKDIPQLQQQLLTDLGLDGEAMQYEVAPGAHYFMGGIKINEQGAASIQGVYAAGECTGGLHGANRLAGNALSENQVFGAIAGAGAAEYALASNKNNNIQERIPSLEDEHMKQFHLRWGFLHRQSSDSKADITIMELTRQLKQTMQRYVGVNRNEQQLQLALSELERIEQLLREQIVLPIQSMPYYRERIKCIELSHMLYTAKAIIYGALERRESRGAHNRTDYPVKQEQYEASIVLKLVDHQWTHTIIHRRQH